MVAEEEQIKTQYGWERRRDARAEEYRKQRSSQRASSGGKKGKSNAELMKMVTMRFAGQTFDAGDIGPTTDTRNGTVIAGNDDEWAGVALTS